jgi:hypothetical protein
MRDETCGAAPCILRAGLASLAVGLFCSCGSEQPASPTPTPSDTTLAFVHVLDTGEPQRYQQVLSTFRVDPRTGALSLVDTKAVPNYSSSNPLAADPRGRFVYVNEDDRPYIGDGSFRSYRVDGSSGTLTLASEVPMKGLHHVRTLAASAGRLYFGADFWFGTSNWYNIFGVFTVDESGVLSGARILVRQMDDHGGFKGILAMDAKRDVVLAGYAQDYKIRALTLDASAAGYREIGRLDLHGSGPGPEGPIASLVATDGRVFFRDVQRRLFSYVLNEQQADFDERGRVPDAGSPGSFGAPDRLAVVTPTRVVPYSYAGRWYSNYTTSIALYRVGLDGGLSLLSRLPESWFVSSPSLAFHPSGRFLYACGIPSDGSPWGSVPSTAAYLATFLIGYDGSMTLYGSLPVAGCGPMVVTAAAS